MVRVIRTDGASGKFANVWFVDGEAHTDNAGALAYFRRRDGYTVVDPPAPAKSRGGRRKATEEPPADTAEHNIEE